MLIGVMHSEFRYPSNFCGSPRISRHHVKLLKGEIVGGHDNVDSLFQQQSTVSERMDLPYI